THEVFSMAGGGYSADTVLGVRPCSDDWRVSNPSTVLVCHATRRGGGSEVARAIQSYCAYGPLRRSNQLGHLLAPSDVFELLASLICLKVVVCYRNKSFFKGKFLRTRPDQQD